MAKKHVDDDVEMASTTDMSADFITHDFNREDLNDLRDKVNEHESLLKV